MRRGWRIAGRNVRVAGVEIDILATRGGVLVAVEVKTRSTQTLSDLALSDAQRRRIGGALSSLVARRPALAPCGVRVDLIIVGPRPWSPMRWITDITAGDDHSPQAVPWYATD